MLRSGEKHFAYKHILCFKIEIPDENFTFINAITLNKHNRVSTKFHKQSYVFTNCNCMILKRRGNNLVHMGL